MPGREAKINELYAQQDALHKQLKKGVYKEDINFIDRVGYTAGSIAAKTMGAVPVIAQTAKQTVLDEAKNVKSEDYRNIRFELNKVNNRINALERKADVGIITSTEEAELKQLRAQRDGLNLNIDENYRTQMEFSDDTKRLYQMAKRNDQKAVEGLSEGAATAYNFGAGIADTASTLPLLVLGPQAVLGAQAAKSAASKMVESAESGNSASQALARGAVSGGITYLTAKAPVEKLAKVVANPAGKATIAAVLNSQGLSEAVEEVAEYSLNHISDLVFEDPNAEFSIEELAMNAVAGYVGGAVFAGMGNAAGTAINYFKNKGTMPQSTAEALAKAVDNMAEDEQAELLQSTGAQSVDEVKQIILALPAKGETTRPTLYYDAEKGLVSDISRPDEIEYFYNTHTLENAPSNQNLINDVLVLADRTGKSAVDIAEQNFAEAETEINNYLQQTIEEYKTFTGEGVALVPNNDGYGAPTFSRQSNNPQWYRDLFAKYGKTPTQEQKAAAAESAFWADVERGGGEFVPPETAAKYKAFKGLAEEIKKLPVNSKAVTDEYAFSAQKGIKPVYSPVGSKQVMVNMGENSNNLPQRNTAGDIAKVNNAEYNNKGDLAHPELAQYAERIKRGEVIPVEEIESLPEMRAAKKRGKYSKTTMDEYLPGTSEGRDAIREEAVEYLFSDKNGAAVFENGKLKKINNEGVYTNPVKQERIADIVIGPPAAGKSTVFADRLSNEHSARILDSDIVKKRLPEFDNGYGASRVQAESAYIVEELAMDRAIYNGDNIILPKIGKSAGSLLKLAQILKENGYTVNLYYNELPTEKAISRAFGRFITEGRYLPINYLKSVNAEDIENTYKQLKESGLIDYYEWKSNDVPYGDEPITKDSGRFGIGSDRQKNDRRLAESGSYGLYRWSPQEIGSKKSTGTSEITDTSSGVSISLPENTDNLPESVGAMKSNPSGYYALANEHGTIEEGEKPSRVVDVPKKSADGKTVSKYARTVMEAEATPDSFIPDMENLVAEGVFSHEVITDKQAKQHAEHTIKSKGWEEALEQWNAMVKSNTAPSKNDIALGQTLYNQAVNAGDTKLAQQLVCDLCVQATRAGQTVQAFRLLKQLTPSGKLYMLQKTVDQLNADLTDRYKGNAETIAIPEELADKLLKSETTEQADDIFEQIEQFIADNTPVTITDKFNAWRYLSMLGNPRTHIRNVTGNAIFSPFKMAKDAIGAQLEKVGVKEGSFHTKAVVNKHTNKDLFEYAEKDFNSNIDAVKGEAKYSKTNAIMAKRQIFKNPFLEKLRKANTAALEAEDMWFLKNHYIKSFAGAMKANGLSVEDAGKFENQELMDNIKAYASNEAQKATYRDLNMFSSLVTKAKRGTSKMGPVGIAAEGILPFAKTPANVITRGVEYSPLNVARGAFNLATGGVDFSSFETTYNSLKNVFNGVKGDKYTAAEALDQLSSGLTGTAICALGVLLASLGWVSGKEDDGSKEGDFEKLYGVQDYALNIGNISYTIDWAAPAAMPFFVGVELYNAATDNDDSTTLMSQVMKLADPVFEMSMLDGLNNAIEATAYSDANGIVSFAESSVLNYAGQFIPTLSGQIARTGNRYRTQTYVDKNKKMSPTMQRFVQQQQAKIPGLNNKLTSYYDQWGRKQDNGNVAERALQNFISPGYISKDRSTDVDNEINRIYKDMGDAAVLPGYASKYFNVNGERVDLTAKEYEKYAEVKGQTAYTLLEEVFKTEAYQSLANDEKADIVLKAYDYAQQKAKAEVSDYELSKQAAKIDENPYKWLMAYGVKTGYTKKADIVEQLEKLGYTRFEAEQMYKEMK